MHFYYCDPLSRQNAKWLSNAIESQSNAIEPIERNRISIEPIERNRISIEFQSNLKIGVIFRYSIEIRLRSTIKFQPFDRIRLRSIGSIAEPVRLTSSGQKTMI